MLPSIQPPVVPLPTEIPGLLQLHGLWGFAELKGLGNPSAKAKTDFPKHLFLCLDTAVQWHSVDRSAQSWLKAPLQAKPKERWDHGWVSWAQKGKKCCEQGGEDSKCCGGLLWQFWYSRCSSELVSAVFHSWESEKQGLDSISWLKIIFHWHWVLALPAGTTRQGIFLPKPQFIYPPAHESESLTLSRC